MADAIQKISKPAMRGLLHSQIKRNLAVGIVLAALSGVLVKVTICDPRKKRYADFYKDYDPEADFQRMRKAGVFQSVSAD